MDILEAFALINVFFQIGNLSQAHIDRKTWTAHRSLLLEAYTLIIFLASVTFLLYGLFRDEDSDKTSENEIGQTVDSIQMVGIRVAHVISITESFVRRKQMKIFVERIREIDKIFECSLNVDVDNHSLRRNLLNRAIVMFSVYMSAEIFILISKLFAGDVYISLVWIIYLLPFLICGLRYFQIFCAILTVRQRFDKLIEILLGINLLHDKSQMERDAAIAWVSKSVTVLESPDMKRLLIVRDLYNRLWELTRVVNQCFGISVLINVGNDFISITSNCYWMFLNFKGYTATLTDFMHIASSAVWSIPHLFNVLMLALLCESTVQRTTTVALGLHRIKTNAWNDNHNTVNFLYGIKLNSTIHMNLYETAHTARVTTDILKEAERKLGDYFCPTLYTPLPAKFNKLEDIKHFSFYFLSLFISSKLFLQHKKKSSICCCKIEQFSLQLLHQKLNFSAAGFFDINCSLLYTIAGATTTYLIILIQFHMNEQKPTSDTI